MLKRITLTLTSLFVALGLTFVASPASAAPTSSDDVGIQAVIGTAWALQNQSGPVFGNINSGQDCTGFTTASGASFIALSATVTTGTVTFYADPLCTVVVDSMTGPSAKNLNAPADAYSST